MVALSVSPVSNKSRQDVAPQQATPLTVKPEALTQPPQSLAGFHGITSARLAQQVAFDGFGKPFLVARIGDGAGLTLNLILGVAHRNAEA